MIDFTTVVLGAATVLLIAGFLVFVRWANEQTVYEVLREMAKIKGDLRGD